jgi:hypothetical protein
MPRQIIAVVDIIEAERISITTVPFKAIHERPYKIASYIGTISVHHHCKEKKREKNIINNTEVVQYCGT